MSRKTYSLVFHAGNVFEKPVLPLAVISTKVPKNLSVNQHLQERLRKISKKEIVID